MRNNIELLAPAGSMEAFIAAVQNGANAVYLGGQNFSARASANNFSNEELAEAVLYAHFRNTKVYVTVNTILDEGEIEKAMDYISFLYEKGVDGLIIQDLGLAKSIKENFPNIEIHASTQMTINSLEGARLLEENSFHRVVLARETPLEEIKLIRDNTNLQIEAFAHGALCIAYSGQCYMSSMIGGRSGNRGRCAQPCRKSYEIVKEDGDLLKAERAYLLSPMDLYTLENIDDLVKAGVSSIKIEGRMKRPEYVATVVAAYRRAIDSKNISGQKKKLKQAFNRGFTEGLAFGAFGENLVDPTRPDNRGLEIGKVFSTSKNKASIEIEERIFTGDVLEFITLKGRKTYSVSREEGPGKIVLNFPFELVKDSEVRRIRNAKEFELAKKSYEEDIRKKPISFIFEGRLGQYPRLVGESIGYREEVIASELVEKAKKAPMDREKIAKQLEKLGDTSFSLRSLEINIDEDIFLPVSVINSLRRDLIEKIQEKIDKASLREGKRVVINKQASSIEASKIKLAVSLEDKTQYYKINTDGIERFYLRFLDRDIYKDLISQNKEVYYRTNKILFHQDYLRIREELRDIELTGLVVDNLGGIYAFKDYKKIGDYGLNIFNSHSVDFLMENGIEDMVLSPELTLSQIQDIRRRTKASLETIGYGFLRVMTMKHCPFSLIKNCDENRSCSTCNFRNGYSIRDEKNVDFRVKRVDDMTSIYNSYPISMIDYIKDLKESGIDYLLLDFSFEDNPQEIIEEFQGALKGKESNLNEKLKEKWKNITYGHYFRGVE